MRSQPIPERIVAAREEVGEELGRLVQRRIKRAGRRWSAAGGDALLALRTRLRSGRPLRPGPRAA